MSVGLDFAKKFFARLDNDACEGVEGEIVFVRNERVLFCLRHLQETRSAMCYTSADTPDEKKSVHGRLPRIAFFLFRQRWIQDKRQRSKDNDRLSVH